MSSRHDAAIHVIKEGDVEFKLCMQGSKQGNACDLDLLEGWDVTVRAAPVLCVGRVFYLYRVTSLMRNGTQLGRYCRTMPRVLQWPQGEGLFYLIEIPL